MEKKARNEEILSMFKNGIMIRQISQKFVLTKMRVIQILVKIMGSKEYRKQLDKNLVKNANFIEKTASVCRCGCGKIVKSYVKRSFYNMDHFRKWQADNKKPVDLEKRRRQMRERYYKKYKINK